MEKFRQGYMKTKLELFVENLLLLVCFLGTNIYVCLPKNEVEEF